MNKKNKDIKKESLVEKVEYLYKNFKYCSFFLDLV